MEQKPFIIIKAEKLNNSVVPGNSPGIGKIRLLTVD